ncbi:MAG: 3-phosphoshikimate 1-carboxyvinyltransferase, partial [Oscillospiraceae bacterium]
DDFIRVKGHLKAGVYELPGDVSSQFVTGLMLALPLLEGNSKIVISSPLESKGYVDITIDVLKSFGISIKNKGYSEFIIKGGQKYKPTDYKVEGDYSQAAFFLVAGALGCDIVCDNLRENSVQGDKKILDIIDKLGGKIRKLDDGGICAVRTDVMHGGVIDARDIPDLVPIIAVLCSFCRGESRIINAGRLRLKESDRLLAISTELKRLGVNIIEGSDSLKIVGGDLLVPNTVSAWNDHRIVMAIAIGACRTEGSIEIVGAEAAVQKSYPEFFEVYKNLTDWI